MYSMPRLFDTFDFCSGRSVYTNVLELHKEITGLKYKHKWLIQLKIPLALCSVLHLGSGDTMSVYSSVTKVKL